MVTLKNTTARLLTHHIPFKDATGVLRSRRLVLVPGKAKEVSKEDLDALKKSTGFQFQLSNDWIICKEVEETVEDAVTISDGALSLAEENGLDIADVEPNAKNKITVAEVKKHLEELEEEDL